MKRQLLVVQLFFVGLAVLGTAFLIVRLGTQRRSSPGSRASPTKLPSGAVVQQLDDPRTRAETARRLGRQKASEAVPLLRRFTKDKDPEVRLACAWALGEIAAPEAVHAVRLLLFDREQRVRLAAAEALGKLGNAAATRALKEALGEKDPQLRLSAAKALACARVAMASDVLVGVLKARDSDPQLRRAAAEALAGRADATATDGLATAVRDESSEVRLAAVRGLAKRRGQPALKAIATALTDADKAVRSRAAEAVADVGRPILPYVEEALAGPASLEARQDAMQVVVRLGGAETAAALIRVLDNIDEDARERAAGLRSAVVRTLTGMGESVLGPLSRAAIYGRCGPVAKEAAAEVCIHFGKPAVEPITKNILRWNLFPDPDELKLWVKTLGELGDPRAAPALNRALAQGIEGIEELVAEARKKIEAKSGVKLPPPVPDPGSMEP